MIKVKNIRCHVGAQIGAEVFSSIDAKIHGCEMVMTKEGVFIFGKIKNKAMLPTFIPNSTISSVTLFQESFDMLMGPPVVAGTLAADTIEKKKTKSA